MSSCIRMRRCCLCLDTGKGTILAAVSSIAAALVMFILIVLGLVYWEQFSKAVRHAYEDVTFISEDSMDLILKVIWWGNIFSLIVAFIYMILCVLLIIGVVREQYKHMIPWISITSMLIPFFITSFLLQLIFGIIGSSLAVIVPAILSLIWCGFWAYGFFCAVSHYRMLKGDIHRPVATFFRR